MSIISLTAEELQGRQLLDETGRNIGEISDLYVDDDGRPHWLLVDTSFFPGFFSVIPVTDVLVTDKGLEVHYDMEKLTGAPNNMKGKDYAKHREGLLYDYYGLEAPEGVEDVIAPRRGGQGAAAAERALPLLDALLREHADRLQRRGVGKEGAAPQAPRPPIITSSIARDDAPPPGR